MDREKQLHRAQDSSLQSEFLGTKNVWGDSGNWNFLRSKRFKSFDRKETVTCCNKAEQFFGLCINPWFWRITADCEAGNHELYMQSVSLLSFLMLVQVIFL